MLKSLSCPSQGVCRGGITCSQHRPTNVVDDVSREEELKVSSHFSTICSVWTSFKQQHCYRSSEEDRCCEGLLQKETEHIDERLPLLATFRSSLKIHSYDKALPRHQAFC